MARSTRKPAGGEPGLGGFLGNLSTLIEQLGELAEKGEELKGLKEFGDRGGLNGVYGFTIKTNRGGDREPGQGPVKVEPFGNVRKDRKTGRVKVHEVLEPMVDVFEEPDHVLVIVELPGVGEQDITLELNDDLLTIVAQGGTKKYRKELLLPAAFRDSQMTRTCRNGVLEVRLTK